MRKILGPEPKFKAPRIWSNREIRKLGKLIDGSVVNVSGWKDEDKEGGHYRDYFHASEYTITNYSSSYKGFQGGSSEIALDLVQPLPDELRERFDTVFNHTTLEHIFEVQIAFKNMATMARKNLLVVVPFLQQQHGPEYGDYWRFTPLAIKKLMEANQLHLQYISANDGANDSVYITALGSRELETPFRLVEGNQLAGIDSNFIGTKIIRRKVFGFAIG
jgi:hypothetical protein